MDEDQDSDEEPALYFPEDVNEEESFSESSSDRADSRDDVEGQIVRRGRSRVWHCLAGCDCERARGRKCECEKRSNVLCGVDCLCDRSKCRTTVREDDDD